MTETIPDLAQMGLPYPKAILFDWDNTLVDTWPVITEALNATRTAFGLETWTLAEARVKSARALRVSFPEWFGDEWERAKDIYYEHFASIHCQRLAVMAQAEELLAFLHDKDIPLFVVSNKRNIYLQAEMTYLGWDKYFKRAVGSGDSPTDKPAREPVELALSAVGLQADDPSIWFVGDTYADVECALRAGCLPVLVHDSRAAGQFGVKAFFGDCHTMKTALYNWSS